MTKINFFRKYRYFNLWQSASYSPRAIIWTRSEGLILYFSHLTLLWYSTRGLWLITNPDNFCVKKKKQFQRRRLCSYAAEFIWGARSRATTPLSCCAASWRLYFGRGTADDDMGAVETIGDLLSNATLQVKSFREIIIQHRAHKRKKIK